MKTKDTKDVTLGILRTLHRTAQALDEERQQLLEDLRKNDLAYAALYKAHESASGALNRSVFISKPGKRYG